MNCSGCKNKQAVRTIYTIGRGETCEVCGGHGLALGKEKTTGFAFNGKLLKKNSNVKLARQVRTEYAGDASDESRGSER